MTGATVAGVLAVAARAAGAGDLDRVLIALLGLLALAAFEAVQPLSAAARALTRTLSAGRRLLELTDSRAAVVDPARPAPAPHAPFTVASTTSARAMARTNAPRSTVFRCAWIRAGEWRS
jgi:ABC-type transport system involved in cytochrome bd biosynthesis fused ATPase/permease subunit